MSNMNIDTYESFQSTHELGNVSHVLWYYGLFWNLSMESYMRRYNQCQNDASNIPILFHLSACSSPISILFPTPVLCRKDMRSQSEEESQQQTLSLPGKLVTLCIMSMKNYDENRPKSYNLLVVCLILKMNGKHQIRGSRSF